MTKGCVHGTATLDTAVLLKGPCILKFPVFCSVLKDALSAKWAMAAASAITQALPTFFFITYPSWVAERKQLSGHLPVCLDNEVRLPSRLHTCVLTKSWVGALPTTVEFYWICTSELLKIHAANCPLLGKSPGSRNWWNWLLLCFIISAEICHLGFLENCMEAVPSSISSPSKSLLK